jgi:hypothetical protein
MATNLQFIKQTSASGVSSMDITNCFSSIYDNYYLTITDYEPSGGLNLDMRLIDSGGSVISDSEYDRAFLDLLANASFSESAATNSNIFNVTAFNNGHSNGTGASFTIFNPFDSSAFTFGQGQTSDYSGNGRGRKMIMVHKSAEQITGVNFSTSSGSFDTTVSVYGIL